MASIVMEKDLTIAAITWTVKKVRKEWKNCEQYTKLVFKLNFLLVVKQYFTNYVIINHLKNRL